MAFPCVPLRHIRRPRLCRVAVASCPRGWYKGCTGSEGWGASAGARLASGVADAGGATGPTAAATGATGAAGALAVGEVAGCGAGGPVTCTNPQGTVCGTGAGAAAGGAAGAPGTAKAFACAKFGLDKPCATPTVLRTFGCRGNAASGA